MTKTELMENYTMEQLADKYLRLQEKFNRYTEVIKGIVSELPEELKNGTEFHLKIDRLQSKVEKYRKAFEDAKKERDCQIAEYQKNIEELTDENAELHCELQAVNAFQEGYPTEPIKVADMLINATYTREKGDVEKAFCKALGNNSDMVEENVFGISELRQIAEHLLVYCNHNEEEPE